MSKALYSEMKSFIGFDAEDEANLTALQGVIAKHGARITDAFYATLEANETTAALIAGRVDRLKATHARWMGAMVGGDYGDAWFEQQERVGNVHVQMGISPFHVELTFSLLRDNLIDAIAREEPARAAALSRSAVKALDMSLALINHAYAEERLNRLAGFTGFSRKLIETCINKKAKA
ncbi:MAG: protoglobin domain-containing protein [Myxococcota bacterium]